VISVLAVYGGEGLVPRIRESFAGQTPVIEHGSNLQTAEELRRRMHFDLIVADREKPDNEFLQWVERLRRGGDRAPLLCCAGRRDDKTLLSVLRAGADDFVLRDSAELEEAGGRALLRLSMPGEL
jgi:two-component system NtrC family response regulator